MWEMRRRAPRDLSSAATVNSRQEIDFEKQAEQNSSVAYQGLAVAPSRQHSCYVPRNDPDSSKCPAHTLWPCAFAKQVHGWPLAPLNPECWGQHNEFACCPGAAVLVGATHGKEGFS